MVVQALAFYLFAAVTVACGVMVITARNPVHAVLFLILAFFNAAGLFVLQGAEFLAMILVIVYVGAVAVLFLFVVMMLDVNFAELRAGFAKYLPIGAVISLILLVELVLLGAGWAFNSETAVIASSPTPPAADVHNTEALGMLLYTKYVYLFQGAGMILLVAMVGAIVLTHRVRAGVKRQRIGDQVARSSKDEVKVVKVQTGSGI
ncbi:NADH-quinone oxidoreductase subunit J [Hwanghaeella grinnelliae]|uniref:NADH-quinone oxidoreductase subunit J n=1 Tax=Hwanghaeella grinnelliae TaxID=2500179 RepID=A0A3S2Y5X6_9PROT|nr:NADH-quinone oxidoreductase subunit J [Hwanghaeella grinnelliae]RVU39298.1 NADH-quinone oxidoreductase subunit J [Hwanghaeella grinnelliae]